MNNNKDKIDVFLEYYVELPFNLALPTGYYALNIPRQLRVHRDMHLYLPADTGVMMKST